MIKKMNRKDFIHFLGVTTVVGAGMYVGAAGLVGCTRPERVLRGASPLKAITPISSDEVTLTEGLQHQLLIGYKDRIKGKDFFGCHSDFTAFLPGDDPDEGILWVNHESFTKPFVSGWNRDEIPTREQAEKELYVMGGSFVKVRREGGGNATR